MSESATSTISGTGTFRIPALPAASEKTAASGKAMEAGGKELPALPDRKEMERVAEAMNKRSQNLGRDLRFEVDLDSGRSVIQVLDRETGEVIRQIPPEKVRPQLNENGALEVRLYDEVV